MRNLLRRAGYGIVLWAVPYAAAVPMLPILHSAPLVFKALDKAAKSKVIEKNKASRLKSRLSQLINKSTKASS